MEDERLKNKNFIDAWKKAFTGIWFTIKTQRNFKIQLVCALIVVLACVIFKLTVLECLFLTIATMLVLIVEMINTAIEQAVNLCTSEYHPIAKIAKDVAAGADVLATINAVIVAILIVVGRIIG